MALTDKERQDLIEEQNKLDEKIKNSAFVSPKDFRRTNEITSLLISDGEETEIRFKFGKMKKSKRVTSFTRDRR